MSERPLLTDAETATRAACFKTPFRDARETTFPGISRDHGPRIYPANAVEYNPSDVYVCVYVSWVDFLSITPVDRVFRHKGGNRRVIVYSSVAFAFIELRERGERNAVVELSQFRSSDNFFFFFP